jgi:hypothetical protein
MMKREPGYKIEKHRGLWWLIDEEGYEVSYIGYETKREAIDAAKVRVEEDEIIDKLQQEELK